MIAWSWQRLLSAVFAAAGSVLTLILLINVIFTGYLPSATTIWVFFVVNPFAIYLFGSYALTGNLPKFMQDQNLRNRSDKNSQ